MTRNLNVCSAEKERSQNIPIYKTISRTPSETQLQENNAIADYHDYCMFIRIVNGLNEKKNIHQNQGSKCCRLQKSTEESLANIIRTRHMPVVEPSSYEYRQVNESRNKTTKNDNCQRDFFIGSEEKSFDSCTRQSFTSYSYEEDDDSVEDRGIFVMDL